VVAGLDDLSSFVSPNRSAFEIDEKALLSFGAVNSPLVLNSFLVSSSLLRSNRELILLSALFSITLDVGIKGLGEYGDAPSRSSNKTLSLFFEDTLSRGEELPVAGDLGVLLNFCNLAGFGLDLVFEVTK
jgi:hypothetical protein